MGFPQVFYCVCEEPGCPWSEYPIEDGEVEDERVRRIPGSSYWNTCQWYRAVVFEAVYIRALRELVESGSVSPSELAEVLDHIVRDLRPDPQFRQAHARAISLIDEELRSVKRQIGAVNGHLREIIRFARNLAFRGGALLDERYEPHYWPSTEEADAVIMRRAFAEHAAERTRGFRSRQLAA